LNSLIIKSVRASGQRLTVDFRCQGQIGKFFREKKFYADYNTIIQDIPEEILVIPFLAAVLPIVWASHAVVYANTVDQTFLRSMEEYKKALQRMYPKLSLRGRLVAKQCPKRTFGSQSKNMMLFSGGVDALATFLRHKKEELTLVFVHGSDIEPDNDIGWAGAIGPIIEFARDNRSPLRTVRSNCMRIIDFLIIRAYEDCIEKGHWWGNVAHGLALIGLCAPLAYVERTGKLYIASSYTSDFSGGWGSHPTLDTAVKWAGTEVIHDGYELSRQDKLFAISNYVKTHAAKVKIRACLSSKVGGNCGRCEKCSRTILGLELAGLDPNKYGFSLEPDTFLNIKQNLLNGGWQFGDDQIFMWSDIKHFAYLKNNVIHPEARSLIRWIENVDVPSLRTARPLGARPWEHKYDFGKKLNPFFLRMPNPVYRLSRKLYFILISHFPFFE